MNRRLLTWSAHAPAAVLLLIALSCGAWQSSRLARDHEELAAELASLRPSSEPNLRPTAGSELARVQEELANESARLEDAEAKLREVEKGMPEMTGEELRSVGRMEQFAQKAAVLIQQVAELGALLKDKSGSARKDEALDRAMQQMGQWASWLDVIAQMESNPQEIAQLHALTIAERLGLDQSTTARVADQIASEFTDLAASGLIRPERPESAEAANDWNEKRSQALHAAAGRIERLIPESQRQPWIVEQSLQLGNAMRHNVQVGADGHGSVSIAVVLPGVQM